MSCNFLHSPALSFHIFFTFHIRRKSRCDPQHTLRFALGNLKQRDSWVEAPKYYTKATPDAPVDPPCCLPHISLSLIPFPTSHPTGQPRASRENRQAYCYRDVNKRALSPLLFDPKQSRNVWRHTSHHIPCAEDWSLFLITRPNKSKTITWKLL